MYYKKEIATENTEENEFMTKKNTVAKYAFVSIHVLVSCLTFLCTLCGNSFAQDWKTLKDGVEYAEVTKEISGLKVNMNLLRLDLSKVRLDVHHAMDAASGTEKTSSIATRHGAFAAINAGFFRLDNSIWAGDPAGALQIDGSLISEVTVPRTAMVILNELAPVEVSVNLSSTKGQAYFISLDATEITFEKLESENRIITKTQSYAISGLNRERKENELLVFTSEFGRTTLTDSSGLEITVRGGKVVAIMDMTGSSQIPSDGYIVSASGVERERLLKEIKLKQKLTLDLRTMRTVESFDGKSKWKSVVQAEDIVTGVPQLIKNSKIDITWEQEKTTKSFVETRHPRTAVAKLKSGKFLMITVDGRSESSGGIGLQDLAEYLLSLGATDAMNLDGGGSTTMFLDGKVVNKPSDKDGERKVSDAILVTLRKKK